MSPVEGRHCSKETFGSANKNRKKINLEELLKVHVNDWEELNEW